MITPETLVRHELVGLPVRVVESSDPTLVERAGTVVEETTNTLVVDVGGERAAADGSFRVRVPKAACTFEFRLDDGEHVTVDGERLVARPARRTERRGDSRWQQD